jgi:hypothetical protein
MQNATIQDRVRKPYRRPELIALGGLVASTAAGSGAMAETFCLVQTSLSGGMMATRTDKQVRC